MRFGPYAFIVERGPATEMLDMKQARLRLNTRAGRQKLFFHLNFASVSSVVPLFVWADQLVAQFPKVS